MNYRHIYHAGNFADVFKHAIQTLLLQYLCQKPKGFSYIDTHAAIGVYDLRREEAGRSPEYLQGIYKLLQEKDTIPELKLYLEIVKSYQQSDNLQHMGSLAFYPGSPLIAKHFIREQDQMVLNELHREDFFVLKKLFSKMQNCHCHNRDAYEFLPAVLPPSPKRGLVLIDPPFEKTDEFAKLGKLINKCYQRFANGIYCIWYPIVSLDYQRAIKKMLRDFDMPLLHCNMTLSPISFEKQRLNGCGVIILNPPWQIELTLNPLIDYLWNLFKLNDESGFLIELMNEK